MAVEVRSTGASQPVICPSRNQEHCSTHQCRVENIIADAAENLFANNNGCTAPITHSHHGGREAASLPKANRLQLHCVKKYSCCAR